MSPSCRMGCGDLRKMASKSAKSTWKPASSTRRPKRCRSPMTLSFEMVTLRCATRGSSSPGGESNLLSKSPSFSSMATSTKLRILSRRAACA
eukprot:6198366-Pleurochrysis_carterae.AAC.3